MGKSDRRVFLDTSVIFAAVLSETGGARLLFRLGETGMLQLVIGPNVLRDCESVVRRKTPGSLPTLALLLELGHVEIAGPTANEAFSRAQEIVSYEPDAHVLGEAISASPDWFVTHDQAHFLNLDTGLKLPFRIGTPGDLIRSLRDGFTRE
jgi:predicted nucleic acid-binding protein